EFQSVDNAVEKLTVFASGFTLQDKVGIYDDEYIIKESVGNNIYRALPHPPDQKPSDIYRCWIRSNLSSIISDLNEITSHEEYQKFHSKYTESLINHWAETANGLKKYYIGYGPASKIINLIAKMIQKSKQYNRESLYPFIHVPFDNFTLKPLRNIINDLTCLKYKITIPEEPAMSFITNPELYDIMQNAVSKLCNKADIYPIVYEYWCWDEHH
ncbi:MAG: hypothetical protein ACYC4Q_12090, partial [Victivallaceae bacterium]